MAKVQRGEQQKTNEDATSRKFCAHCGLPIGKSSRGNYNSHTFCCAGCEGVYQLIHRCGLDGFYSHTKALEARLKPVENNKTGFEYFDDPLWIEKNCQHTKDGETVYFLLDSIQCAACIWLLEKLPGLHPGILSAAPNFTNSSIKVLFDSKKASPSVIASLINSLGYIPYTYSKVVDRQQSFIDRDSLLRIGVAGFAAGNTMLLAIPMYQASYTGMESSFRFVFQVVSFLLTLAVVFYSASPFYRTAIGGLRARKVHIDAPISLGILFGFIGSTISMIKSQNHVYFDSVCALVFFLLVGRALQQHFVNQAKNKIANQDYLPEQIKLKINGEFKHSLRERAQEGDIVEVEEQQTVPCDGKVLTKAVVSNAHLSGESLPLVLDEGQMVYAGARCLGESFQFVVVKTGENTRIGGILNRIEKDSLAKTPYSAFTQRLSSIFLLMVILSSIFTIIFWWQSGVYIIIERLVALLVISCPCALGLSVPLASAVSVSRALKKGVYIKSADVFERLMKVRHWVFDKTGTLTAGSCSVRQVKIIAGREECFKAIAGLEKQSEHPIGRALYSFVKAEDLDGSFSQIEYIPGKGVQGVDKSGSLWRLGQANWINQQLADQESKKYKKFYAEDCDSNSTIVLLSKGATLQACFAVGDQVHSGMEEFIVYLKTRGRKVSILSGDQKEVVLFVARKLGVENQEAFWAQDPESKKQHIQIWSDILPVAMVGDGVNDACALSSASVGIAIRGSVESALQSADLYVPAGNVGLLRYCYELSRGTVFTIQRNFFFSLLYNSAGIFLAVGGYVTPLIAAILMPLSSFTVILSSVLTPDFFVEKKFKKD